MDVRLHEAAIRGDVTSLLDLLQRDDHVLNGVMVMHGPIANENPLHVATQFGHVDFAKEILSRKPEYALKLNSQGQSLLHLASGAGHVEVVKLLLEKDAGVCFVRDIRGRTSLHIVARKGRLGVLKELVCAKPTATWVQTEQGEPILHLCASNGPMDFQAALNPPGGVWQDDYPPFLSPLQSKAEFDQWLRNYSHDIEPNKHYAGEAVMSSESPIEYLLFSLFNLISLVSYAGIILLLISGFDIKRRWVMWALMITTWISISSMGFSIAVCSYYLTNYYALSHLRLQNTSEFPTAPAISIVAVLVLIGPLVTAHSVRLVIRLYKKFNRRAGSAENRDVAAIQVTVDPSTPP